MLRTILIILFIVFLLYYFHINVQGIVNMFFAFMQFLIDLVHSILNALLGATRKI